MVAKRKETAEQKLLKMIEASSGENVAAAKTKQKVVKKRDALFLVKFSNSVLVLGVIAAILYLGYEVKNGMETAALPIDGIESSPFVNRGLGVEALIPNVQNLAFYLSAVNRRDIFRPYQEIVKDATSDQVPKTLKITEKTSHLKLVGISWLDTIESASVMIEDADKQLTYFLKRGDELDEINIKTIYADGVELGYKDEEMTLRYEESE